MTPLQALQRYFLSIAHELGEKQAKSAAYAKHYFHEEMCKQIDFSDSSSALFAYLNQTNTRQKALDFLCFPFGLNDSQFKAVTQVFENQISMIQGPPGTGKTQTILNIIANAVINKKSVAIVSPNNSATDNVFEKLEAHHYAFIAANMGKKEKRDHFFAHTPPVPAEVREWYLPEETLAQEKKYLDIKLAQLKKYLIIKNDVCILQQELREWVQEKKYFDAYFEEEVAIKTIVEEKLKRLSKKQLSEQKQLQLIVDLSLDGAVHPHLLKKIKYFFQYGIYHFHAFRSQEMVQDLLNCFEQQYYETKIDTIKANIAEKEAALQVGNYPQMMQEIARLSEKIFRAYLAARYTPGEKRAGKGDLYHQHETFALDFPVTLSTNDAILTNIQSGKKFDYVIMDEASMGAIVPSIFALSAAKNIVIVGDRNQLPHIQSVEKVKIKEEVAPCYDYFEHSILSSMEAVYGKELPSVLLREHYRCHPMIINFCNKEFYNNELIIMTEASDEEKPLFLLETNVGNHMKFDADYKVFNQREIDSILFEDFKRHCPPFRNMKSVAFITPFKRQAQKAQQSIDAALQSMDAKTVHKYQGRSCEAVIFSTVLDNKGSQKNYAFVERDELINVAVSRAEKLFVLDSSVETFSKRNKRVASLIRYMKYYSDYALEHKSNVRSIFDLLTKDYQKELAQRRKQYKIKHSKYDSENLMMDLIDEVLKEEKYQALTCATEYPIKKMARDFNCLTKEECAYVKNGARLDFVFYFKNGKEPIGALEVDGHAFHSKQKQKAKDECKNCILRKLGIDLERFSTTGSEEKHRLRLFLDRLLQPDA